MSVLGTVNSGWSSMYRQSVPAEISEEKYQEVCQLIKDSLTKDIDKEELDRAFAIKRMYDSKINKYNTQEYVSKKGHKF